MKRYWTLFSGLILLLLTLFGVAQWAGLDLERLWVEVREWSPSAVALLGISLLIIDVVLPVPSILVIIGLGHLFGTWVGSLLSLLGMLLACLFAFGLGRSGRGRIGRWVGVDEQARADALLTRWGMAAIIVSRPLPVLAEAVAMMAGTTNMRWAQVACAAIIGSAPVCLLYAAGGAGFTHLEHEGLMCAAVVALAAVSWFMARRFEERISESE